MVSQGAESSNVAMPVLLGCGVVAGPLYLAVGLAQALTREGFDLARHPLSVLAQGPGGWVQVANLAITGLMVVAAAVGIGRTVSKSRVATWTLAVFGLGIVVSAVFRADPMDGFPPGTPEGMPTSISTSGLMVIAASVGIGRTVPKSRVATWALAVYGLGMVVSAIFRADPMDGFPPGTPEGMPTAISTAGLMHFASGGVAFLALAVSGLAMAWTMRRGGRGGLALLSLVSGLTVLVGFFGGMALQLGVWGIWAAVVMGWIWLSVLSFSLRRQA